MSQWFYMKGDLKRGPVDTATLRQLAASGELTPTDRIWREGLSGWVRASQAKGLFPEPLPAREQDEYGAAATAGAVAQRQPAREERACPFCGESILVVAKKCKHCGEFLDEGVQVQPSGDRPGMWHAGAFQSAEPTKAKYNPGSDTFAGTMTLLVKLAMRAVQELGWKLENANENLGLVTFETGISWGSWSGISCSLNIEEVSENQFRVTGRGKQNVRGGQLLAINFGGEAESKVRKAINRMKELAR
jgi:hypothetical protein